MLVCAVGHDEASAWSSYKMRDVASFWDMDMDMVIYPVFVSEKVR